MVNVLLQVGTGVLQGYFAKFSRISRFSLQIARNAVTSNMLEITPKQILPKPLANLSYASFSRKNKAS